MKKILIFLLFIAFSLANTTCAYRPYGNIEILKKALVEIETISITETKEYGKGFIIDNENRILMTNCHVVDLSFQEFRTDVNVYLSDGRLCKAIDIIDCNIIKDIAFLKIDCDCDHLPALKIKKEKIKEGDKIILLDAVEKKEGEVEETDLIIERKDSDIPTSYIAVTTPFWFGKSGTPILNKDYYVIAIAGAILKKDEWIYYYLAVPLAD